MSRTQREEALSTTKNLLPPGEEFIPSAKPARYDGAVQIHETSETLAVEDDELETEWYNPTPEDVVLPVHVGTDPKNKLWRHAFIRANPQKQKEMQTGIRVFIVKAKSSRKIPSEFDLAIQRTHCLVCSQRKDQCKDLDHPRVVVAGLGPQLVCKKWHKIPSLAAALDASRAQAQIAKEQIAEAAEQRIRAEAETESAKAKLREALAAAEKAEAARLEAEAELKRVRDEAARAPKQK